MEQYKKTHEINPELSYSEKEIDDYSNLNENFVNNAFPIPYEQAEDFKSGTFTYTYYLYPGNSIFGWLSYMILYIKRLKYTMIFSKLNLHNRYVFNRPRKETITS